MDIGAVGDDKGKDKKGKKGDKGDKSKGEGDKDKGGKGKGKDTSADKPCPICGPDKGKNHCLNDCFHNAKSPNAKGKGKGKAKDRVHAVGEESTAGASSSSSGGLSQLDLMMQAFQQFQASQNGSEVSQMAPSASASNTGRRPTHNAVYGAAEHTMFAVGDEDTRSVRFELDRHFAGAQGKPDSTVNSVRSAKSTARPTKYIMLDSGAWSSCTLPGAFAGPVDETKKKRLFSIHGEELRHDGTQQAPVRLQAETKSGQAKPIKAVFNLDVTSASESVMALRNVFDNAD